MDTDPGKMEPLFRQRMERLIPVESILPKDLNVTGLSVGPHLVGVRYKDNNNMGEVLYQTIHVYNANPSGVDRVVRGGGSGSSSGFATIQAAEYFVDTDPGRKWHRFQAKDGAFDSEVESILPKDLNVTGLSVGPHLVGVRYKDNNNLGRSFTRPYMSTMPIHRAVVRVVRGWWKRILQWIRHHSSRGIFCGY